MNNILIINTKKTESAWFEYFKELDQRDFNLRLLGNDQKLLTYFKSKKWPSSTLRILVNPQANFFSSLLFTLLRPILFFFALLRLSFFKFSKKIDTIVCFGFYEKLHFTRAANLLKYKIIWVIVPGEQFNIPRLSLKSFSNLSKMTTTLCFNQKYKKILDKKKIHIKNIEFVKIGIKNNSYFAQKNIFENLAKQNSSNIQKKYFTIGTIQNLDGDIGHLEKLLHATKKCLEIIPQIQLIIAGEGEGRKKLTWMSKKMGIDNLVWFVGNHRHPKKWLSNFDLFISTSPNPKLQDFNIALLSSLASLAVIAPIDAGFSEYIKDNKSGLLVDINDSEKLASVIIDLQQNKNKREAFGKTGLKYITNNFQLDKTIEKISSILKN